ncbi:hypothetical protein PV10_05193 [Exophiala mesophila]|uniref:UBL3-like ubiquitin domain-containing protein n=1 Tax=Exophiala mesophila TaxID=212818 RepID=A0A0D1WXD3_EXOME|nr:uncharacterized protein PV10_05193 [Exophiala mesophila]KIV94035.1 hypothetical protein PV10_05193 [Exophiala mesophila]
MMAGTTDNTTTTSTDMEPSSISSSTPPTLQQPASLPPLEMSSLPSSSPLNPSQPPLTQTNTVTTTTSVHSSEHPPGPQRTDTHTAIDQSLNPQPPPPASLPTATRTFSTAIGPSSDSPVVPAKDPQVSGPVLLITLLLTSGARHPFKLDSKYLAKRNVELPEGDPFNLSVYKLKELILREWRDEWEAKPSSPNYIRLISFGKLLDDKAALKDYKFSFDSPNVLHMTIKPQDFIEDEDAKGAKSSFGNQQETESRSPGCRCVIM